MVRAFLKTLLAGAALAVLLASARAETKLTIMVFQGIQNLPFFAAQANGFFAKRDLSVEIKIAPTSDELRNGLAEGRYQIVHGGVDNAIAMAEVAKQDIAIVCGGDNGWLELVAQPDVESIAALRGKTVAVDAPNTAYAIQLYDVLARNGLNKGDYGVRTVGATFRRGEAIRSDKSLAGTMLNPPFSVVAKKAGLKSLGSAVKIIGPYQATSGFVMRAWARQNEDVLVKYLQAYIEAVRWSLNPANKTAAVKLIAEGLKIPEDVAEQSYAVATGAEGFDQDARIDLDALRNVLKLRATHLGTWGGNPPSPEKYLDLSYYEKAKAGM